LALEDEAFHRPVAIVVILAVGVVPRGDGVVT
jgi:hypothetical protein